MFVNRLIARSHRIVNNNAVLFRSITSIRKNNSTTATTDNLGNTISQQKHSPKLETIKLKSQEATFTFKDVTGKE